MLEQRRSTFLPPQGSCYACDPGIESYNGWFQTITINLNNNCSNRQQHLFVYKENYKERLTRYNDNNNKKMISNYFPIQHMHFIYHIHSSRQFHTWAKFIHLHSPAWVYYNLQLLWSHSWLHNSVVRTHN